MLYTMRKGSFIVAKNNKNFLSFSSDFGNFHSADINNVINWYTIKLVLNDRTEVPLFIAGEFEPRDWFGGWQSNMQTTLYHKLGLIVDVNGHCQETLETLLKSFESAGYELPLI